MERHCDQRDGETGSAQGDGSLAGAVYGVYQGDKLIGTYTTNAAGQFTTDYHPCGDNWSIREVNVYLCLPDLSAAVLIAGASAYTDTGEPLSFSHRSAQSIRIMEFEEAIELLHAG